MNKAHLIEAVAERFGGEDYDDDPRTRAAYRKRAAEAVEEVLSAIAVEMAQGGTVRVTGFGTFEVQDVPARYARNPQTGERVRVKKCKRAKFIPGQNLTDLVNKRKKAPRKGSAIQKAPKGSLQAK